MNGKSSPATDIHSSGFSSADEADRTTVPCPNQAPDNHYVPCDLEELVVKDNTAARQVGCAVPFALEDPAADGHQEAVLKLAGYDLLLETLADYEVADGKKPKRKASVVVESTPHGDCPSGNHPELSFRARDGGDKQHDASWVRSSHAPFNLLAAPSSALEGKNWLQPFWDFSTRVCEYEAVGQSCGVRASGTPVVALRALIRVYPNDVYELSLAVPPMGKISRNRAGSIDAKGGRTSSQSQSSKWGDTSETFNQSHTTNTASGDNFTKQSISRKVGKTEESFSVTEGHKGGTIVIKESYKSSATTPTGVPGVTRRTGSEQTDSSEGPAEFLPVGSLEFEPSISLSKNGQELAISEALNDILNVAAKIRDAWNEIQNWVPSIGWKASLEVSVLEGDITGRWGNEVRAQESSRLALVEPFYELEIKITFLKYKLALMVGIEVRVENWFASRPVLELIIKAEGSISGGIELTEKLSSKQDYDPISFNMTSKPQVLALARAQLLGLIVEARVSIDGGITLEGSLQVRFDQDPIFDAKLKMEKTDLNVKLMSGKKRPYRKNVELFKEYPFWGGQFPKSQP